MADGQAAPSTEMDAPEIAEPKPIFDGVYFAIVPSLKLSEERITKLTIDLENNGGTHCPLTSTELHQVTHLISSTSDFPAFHDAVDAFIHVVKPQWVDQSILRKRCLNPRQYSPDPKLFLSDVILTFADDIPQGDKDAIIGGLTAMGGQYSAVLTKLVTHIIALTTENKTCNIATEKNLQAKPVLPHWFDACLRLGKKIGHEPYMLPNPPILSSAVGEKLKHTSEPSAIISAFRLEHPEAVKDYTIPISPSKERKELSVLRNKRVLLLNDLGLSERLRRSLGDIIYRAGGEVTSTLEGTDILICRYRDNAECKYALEHGLDVGNLSWLYYLINHNTWTDPMRRLLHFPFPRDGIDGVAGTNIAVSNYSGEARVYIESLIKAAGGKYTKTMSQQNTHLITAHVISEKCVAAREWGINIINHLWLEESYANWKFQAVTNPRYTTFPTRTNLCEVVGQTSINREALHAKLLPGTPNATAGQEEEEEEDFEDSTLAHTPITTQAKPPKSTQKATRTPLLSRLRAEPVQTPGSRGAKDRALKKLHAMAPDIELFQKETKRVGGVIYGGRRVTDPERILLNASTGRKRSSSAAELIANDDAETEVESHAIEESAPQKKKTKTSKTASTDIPQTTEPQIKVLLTGVERDNNHSTPKYKQNLRSLNITIVENADAELAVIVAPRMLRTKKFLLGLAAGPAVVKPKWLDDMIDKKQRLPYDDYFMKDEAYENEHYLRLGESLERARKHKAKGGMFRGWTIFCTENSKGGFSTYDDIIKANGGRCLQFKGRKTTLSHTKDRGKENVSGDWMMEDGEGTAGPERRGEEEYLYLISDEKDKSLWAKFADLVSSQGYVPRVVRPDWLLRIAQSQEPDDWQEDWSYLA